MPHAILTKPHQWISYQWPVLDEAQFLVKLPWVAAMDFAEIAPAVSGAGMEVLKLFREIVTVWL